jgi:hypothetical protein
MKKSFSWRRYFFQAMVGIMPGLASGQPSLPSDEVAQVENAMAQWLSHPIEFGVPPRSVRYLRSVSIRLADQPAPVVIHMVEYLMPNGIYGRGFVNPVAWSFLGPVPYDKLTDIQLVTAYLGWLWLSSAIQEGRASASFEAHSLKPLIAELNKDGVSGVVMTEQTKVGNLEFFEFTGVREGKPVKGAGAAGSKLILDASSPAAFLPVLYTYLGLLMQEKI